MYIGHSFFSSLAMKYLLFFLILAIGSCETNRFDSDKRQIIAKDAIRSDLKGAARSSFTVTGFKEDTLFTYADTLIKKPIQYTLYFTQKDSTGQLLQHTGIALFTNKGNSLISSNITDQQP